VLLRRDKATSVVEKGQWNRQAQWIVGGKLFDKHQATRRDATLGRETAVSHANRANTRVALSLVLSPKPKTRSFSTTSPIAGELLRTAHLLPRPGLYLSAARSSLVFGS
jgi:hypothetical protein